MRMTGKDGLLHIEERKVDGTQCNEMTGNLIYLFQAGTIIVMQCIPYLVGCYELRLPSGTRVTVFHTRLDWC